MIPKIKKILYATDLSKHASYAFSYALSLAMQHDAKISIIMTSLSLRHNEMIYMHASDAFLYLSFILRVYFQTHKAIRFPLRNWSVSHQSGHNLKGLLTSVLRLLL